MIFLDIGHTEGDKQQQITQRSEEGEGSLAGCGRATRDVSLEPATGDESLTGEQQTLEQQVE